MEGKKKKKQEDKTQADSAFLCLQQRLFEKKGKERKSIFNAAQHSGSDETPTSHHNICLFSALVTSFHIFFFSHMLTLIASTLDDSKQ